MRREPNKTMIGAFMLVGIGVLAFIVGSFLEEKLFGDKKEQLVMYFDETIKGLNVGSPVVFQGVEIGKVSKIDLIANPQSLDFSIPVFVRMNRQSMHSIEEYHGKEDLLNALIKKGLRARLTTQSYVTGQLMIEFEMLPDTPIVLKNKKPGIMEIPTTLSPMGELSRGLQTLPIRHSVESFNQFFDHLNAEMPQIRKIVNKVDKVVSSNSQTSADAVTNFSKAMLNISEAAKSVRNLSDYLERHPEALLKGKGRY